MAISQENVCGSLEAGSDLSASQYHFVSVAADGQVDATGDGAMADGVLLNDPAAAGRPATVCVSGFVKVKAGAAITRGDYIASDASGKAVAATTTGDVILGTALEAATADGDIISIIFAPRGLVA